MNDFTGFRLGNIHSKDLHLVVVSSGDRYEKNLLPDINNYTSEVPGGNGQYYFGSTFKAREFSLNVAFDSIDEDTWRKISEVLANDKPQDLVFDELPYKTFRAKLSGKPQFKFICFKDSDGNRVYKGEGELKFICFFPFAYGLNKYIIRAADDYLLQVPNLPDYDKDYHNPYKDYSTQIYNTKTKKFYNVPPNMDTPWKGGFPTIEQVRAGELYFTGPKGKTLIDVRDYFRNVPEWAHSSKLLVTPTLDYDQQLIFLPQYSKGKYINMDIGLNRDNALMGSRILVYNPGDLPIDFKLKLDNNERTFWTGRGGRFQVRRYNVQRLSIPQAVDWTGLKTYDESENGMYKYGKKYFKYEHKGAPSKVGDVMIFNKTTELLGDEHPDFAYIAEPIPQEKLGHYIRLFFWQSTQIHTLDDYSFTFEEGKAFADRYEELYSKCITDDERNELYWDTLKKLIGYYGGGKLFSSEYCGAYTGLDAIDIDDFIYDYIHKPTEYIRRNKDNNYGEELFNIDMMPQWVTQDYLEIEAKNFTSAQITIDTEKRMIYNVNYKQGMYDYKEEKTIYNDNIIQGKWFKIPKGWSLIEVAPVCEYDEFGGKRWDDARPFDWGYSEHKEIQEFFNKVYFYVAKKMLVKWGYTDIDTEDKIEEKLRFRWMFLDQLKTHKWNFAQEYFKTQIVEREYEFLKELYFYWSYQKGTILDAVDDNEDTYTVKGEVDEWWWFAQNYLWDNFPPIYWTHVDILNNAKIDYIPLFY